MLKRCQELIGIIETSIAADRTGGEKTPCHTTQPAILKASFGMIDEAKELYSGISGDKDSSLGTRNVANFCAASQGHWPDPLILWESDLGLNVGHRLLDRLRIEGSTSNASK